MVLVPLLVFASVLVISLGGYFLVTSGDTMSRDVKRRLALLSLRGIEEADIPNILKNELLSDVPALNRVLATFDAALKIDRRLKQAGMQWKVGAFLLLSLSAFAVGLLFGTVVHWPFAFSLAAGLLFLFLPNALVNIRRRRRLRTFVAHFPDALEMFARSLRAGHSFTGAIQLVSQEMPDPVGTEFRQVFDEQNLGVPLREALTGMTHRIDSIEVRFFVTAILIQKETGGNLAEIIDKIAHVIRERFRIEGQLKVFTAQARMTGTILVLLPIGVAVAIGILNPEYMKPLWFEKAGKLMIALAACMQVAGALVIRKIIRIKI
ncbi:MAG: type II secretion system F family protein [Deltaproteobacteria bacterium]|nr:type II secretion system F family protein [Deltaproteobacteria bacterium]